jgi:hypothetical protein
MFMSAEDAARSAGEAMRSVMDRLPHSEWLTVTEVSLALDIDPGTVRGWIDSGRFEVMDLGTGDKRPYFKIARAGFLRFLETRVK